MRIKSDYLPFVLIFFICIIAICFVNFFGDRDQSSVEVSEGSGKVDTSRVDWFVPKTEDNLRPVFPDDVQSYIKKYDAKVMGSEEKEVYLTFNCGYEYKDYTLQILDSLKEQKVKGAFFITGDYLRDNVDIVKRMVDEGHIVGNHGNTHADLSSLTSDEIKAEIVDFERSYKQVMGEDYTDHYFRPASGTFTEESLYIAKELGYTPVFWSFAYEDWDVENQVGVEVAYEKIMSSVHPGCILMLHTVSQSNVEALDQVIADLKGQGYTFKSIEAMDEQIVNYRSTIATKRYI